MYFYSPHPPQLLTTFSYNVQRNMAHVFCNNSLFWRIPVIILAGILVFAVVALDVGRRELSRVVAGARALDLDNVGAEIAENLRAAWTRENTGEVEDADTFQRTGHLWDLPKCFLFAQCSYHAGSDDQDSARYSGPEAIRQPAPCRRYFRISMLENMVFEEIAGELQPA